MLSEGVQYQARIEAFNVPNRSNFRGATDAYTFTNTPSGAQLTHAAEKRDIHFNSRLLF